MFSWISGPRITNVAEDLADTTFIEPPETPAHVFPVRAFKQALFGTPHPDQAIKPLPVQALKQTDKKQPAKQAAPDIQFDGEVMDVDQSIALGLGKPNGILMTPGTASKGRKTVSFGKQVVDNEGKEPAIGKSGLPANFPGKFPSPWTPRVVSVEDSKSRSSKLTEALYDAREHAKVIDGGQSGPDPKVMIDAPEKARARDDIDVTLDLSEPRSESGKYWKEQYLTYAKNSTQEVKHLVKKAKLAKEYAYKVDEKMTGHKVLLEEQHRKLASYASRQRAFEQQNRDLQEQVRRATQDSRRARQEVKALRQQLQTLGVDPVKIRSQRQEEPRIFEDQDAKLHVGIPSLAADSPCRAERKSKSNRPPLHSSIPPMRRRNTSPGPIETSMMSMRPPLQERHSNTSSKENIPPPTKLDIASMKPTPPQSSTEVPSSPDPWVQDLYVSPSKLDKLTQPPSASKPLPQINPLVAQSTFEPTSDNIISMGAKARAALASASTTSLRPREHNEHSKRAHPSLREHHRRPATVPDASDFNSGPRLAEDMLPQHLRGKSVSAGHVKPPGHQHVRRQSHSAVGTDDKRSNSLLAKDREARARERIASRIVAHGGGGVALPA